MMRDVHLDLRPVPPMGQQTCLVIHQVHTQDRTKTQFEDLVLCQNMQTRVGKIEVRHLCFPLGHMPVPVGIIGRQRVQLQGIILHVELQVVALALAEQRILAMCGSQQSGDIIAGVGLDRRIGLDDPVRRQFLQKIIDLRVLDRLGNTLSHQWRKANGKWRKCHSQYQSYIF